MTGGCLTGGCLTGGLATGLTVGFVVAAALAEEGGSGVALG